MGLGAKDLKMGFGNKLSGNFLKETRAMGAVEAEKLGAMRPRTKIPVCSLLFYAVIFSILFS